MIKLKKNIFDFSVGYAFLKSFVYILMEFFYRKIQKHNIGVIPRNAPVILAINHQNALMDAMAVIHSVNKQTVFVARADIFNEKTLRYLMYIKILPIFRIRDGANKVKLNNMVFDTVVEGLKNNGTLGIMPEGSHGNQRKLRPLKKGIFRIGFEAQEKFRDQPGVKIIPVGLEFSDYYNPRSDLFVNIGKPIELADYYKAYKENGPKTINLVSKELFAGLSDVMIDIQQDDYYETFDFLRKFFRPYLLKEMNKKDSNLFNRFVAEKKIISILNHSLEQDPGELSSLKTLVQEYKDLLHKLDLRDWILKKKHNIFVPGLQFLLFVIFSPLYLYGAINNYLPYIIPVHYTKKVKDPQFISSFRFGLSYFLFPAFYLLQTILVAIFVPFSFAWLIYLVSLPLTGLFSVNYSYYFKRWKLNIRYLWVTYRKNQLLKQAKYKRQEILGKMKKLSSITG
ncbi:MAG: 1-acyl-sn-glycerol-3-phosphate acyltransferase [Bacteroidota bacterium]